MKNNQMMINGHVAIINYDPEINLFRGEFIGLNGGADFYADNVEGLQKEGEASLDTFLEVCKEQGLEPYKQFSGKFVTRIPATLHERITVAATAAGVSLNQWIQSALEKEVALN